jgi:broad specificity phosphatase PhoE
MRLIFVRHGETDWNVQRIYQGWTDVPLNALGERQARAAAWALARRTDLTVRAVYASPLLRAWRTAELIAEALGLHPRPLHGLKELHWGEASGLAFAQVAERWPDLAEQRRALGLGFETPGGESGWALRARVSAALDEVVKEHHPDAGPDEAVVIVAHGGSIGFALACLRGDESGAWPSVPLGNAAFCEVRLGRDSAGHEVICVNAGEHLEELDVTLPASDEHV